MKTKNVTMSKCMQALLGLTFLVLTSGCKFSDDRQKPVPSVDPARADGGADSGGGDIILDEPMSDHQFQILQKEGKVFIRGALNHQAAIQESNDEPTDLLAFKGMAPQKVKALYTRLYPATGRTVYDELESVKLVWRAHCEDLKFKDKDGAAFNSDPFEICLNKTSVRAKLTRITGFVLVTSLIGHELVHRMGGTEDDAKMFQLAIQRTLQSGSPHHLLQSLRDPAIPSSIQEIKSKFNNINKIVSNDTMETCLQLGLLDRKVFPITKKDTFIGIKRYKPETSKVVKRAMRTASFLIHYCTKESAEKHAAFETWPYGRYISYLDKEALSYNLEDLDLNLNILFKELQEYDY